MSTADATTGFTFEGVIRFHTKSKSGCLTCRKRRIKCDEAKPTCRNCYRRDLECIQRPKDEQKQERRQQQQELMLHKPLRAPTPVPMGITSLRIMHHFTTATSSSFSSDPETRITFCTTVPQLSWNNPRIFHALLACTALHLGRIYPEEPNWIYFASAHRKAAINASPNVMNLEVKFLVVGFFTMYTISSSLASSPENIIPLMSSLHNVWSVMEGRNLYANQGLKDLEPLLTNSQTDPAVKALVHLKRIYDLESGPGPDSEELFDPGIGEAYKEAVEALWVAYPLSRMGHESKSVVVWPLLFGKKFRDLLNEKRQRALVVLYYYLGMVKGMSEKHWWANDFPKCMEYVYGLLDDEWRDWLRDMFIMVSSQVQAWPKHRGLDPAFGSSGSLKL
ncbi:c6 zinc finger domain protein [Moniliophthora roreri MCA 2997]|uniref:C6 zinc finger domain protein n=2 Tax=Moniliophthora roreri TaxID=221103 RepID=V2YHV2_MONRO|nr:c6 zinc finger domain protein [Moniliophthora roreri MCA 2997]KAI3601658.1 c6 zinc finger domain protein [Moniliophthora roreri]